MPRQGQRGCSGSCPPHLAAEQGGGSGRRPRRCSPPAGAGKGSGMEGRDPQGQRAEPGGSGTAPPPLPARLGRMLGGGAAAESPRSAHPQRGGDAVPVSPFPGSPMAFSPCSRLNFSPRRSRLRRRSPSLITPGTPRLRIFLPSALGGDFPLSVLRSSPRARGWRHLQTFPAAGEAAAGRGWRQSPIPEEGNTSRVSAGWGRGPVPVVNT